jgi:hypothetical protein
MSNNEEYNKQIDNLISNLNELKGKGMKGEGIKDVWNKIK